MEGSGGRRPDLDTLPAAVHARVVEVLGSAVADAVTQEGGFSPGVAARVRAEDGARAFVKAVDGEANDVSRRLFVREAAVVAGLPDVAWRPRLLATIEEEGWIALVLEDVDGATPRLPWRDEDLGRVIDAMAQLAAVPAAVVGGGLLDTSRERFEGVLTQWSSLRAEDGRTGRAWADDHLDELVAAEQDWAAAVEGDRLLHGDLRADNLVLTHDRVVFVDWPHAAAGNPLVDAVALAPSVALQGGPQPEELLAAMPHLGDVVVDLLRPLVVGVAGYLARQATLPPPPNIPAIRQFQARQADVAVPWARRLLDA